MQLVPPTGLCRFFIALLNQFEFNSFDILLSDLSVNLDMVKSDCDFDLTVR